MKFWTFIIPAFLTSTGLFLTFGWLGLCEIDGCLRSGESSFASVLFGTSAIVLAFVPFALTSFILHQKVRWRPLSKRTAIFGWTVVLIIGALGLLQVIIDPLDAFWAGLPMLVFSGLLACSILYFPIPNTKTSQ